MTAVSDPPATHAEPTSVGDLDAKLKGAVKGAHRLRWWVISVVAVALVSAVVALTVIALRQQSELEASCGFWSSAAVVPVNPTPPALRPSLEGVKLIASSRVAYYNQGCSPALPPNPSLQRWADFYHLVYVP